MEKRLPFACLLIFKAKIEFHEEEMSAKDH